MKLYRDRGVVLDKVEYWNSFAGKRKDLFGCIDLVGLTPNNHILGIQSTSGKCRSAHLKKILAEPRIKRWLECQGKFHLVTWTKVKNRWRPRIEEIKKEMYA
jgi:hypothetical protein